jgi:hypothetical protein
MVELVTAFVAVLGFLGGATQNVGACSRPAMQITTEKQNTTVTIPTEVGLNPPTCS